jgi:hypothetical protein
MEKRWVFSILAGLVAFGTLVLIVMGCGPSVSPEAEYEVPFSEMLPVKPQKEYLDDIAAMLQDKVFRDTVENAVLKKSGRPIEDMRRLQSTILGVQSGTMKCWVDLRFHIRSITRYEGGLTWGTEPYEPDAPLYRLYASELNRLVTERLLERYGQACIQDPKVTNAN